MAPDFPESASFELKWVLCKVKAVTSSEKKFANLYFIRKKLWQTLMKVFVKPEPDEKKFDIFRDGK